ncbi:MAG: UDP-3-O-(3-hydroxymyristoyl)glucosamine N-acyltransferase [Armatimonadetes bacterium]|nr:UDP-3-O-(3-hydroxymyristoyl)glucosamine N-acyltransferase [Armatimonadota bacterium]
MRVETTVAELSEIIGGTVIGCPEARITGVGSVDNARNGDVVLAEGVKYFRRAVNSAAACIICSPAEVKNCDGKNIIAVEKPGEAFVKALEMFCDDELLPEVGIGQGAVVEQDVSLGEGVAIGANCFVGRGAALGDGCVLFPNVYVGPGVKIGSGSKLYPGVTVYVGCSIGNRVILHAGAAVGVDGFGYIAGPGGLVKLPHAGSVEIGDDVEIGANSTIDRAKTGATIIGRGTKIDNLVQIAHNVKIGEHCVIVSMVGVAGSVEIGNGVTLAAQAGVKDHIRIGDGAVVAARSGVIGDVAKGSVVSGFPAREHKDEIRTLAIIARLPDILERLRVIEREVRQLREGGEK